MPVIYLDRNISADKIHFEAIKNHFRYLWTLNTTLDCEDATFYTLEKKENSEFEVTRLSVLQNPKLITYAAKAETTIKRNSDLQYTVEEEHINNWKMRLSYILKQQIRDFRISPSKEKIFLACSWKKNGNGKSKPNPRALILQKHLEKDFSKTANIHLLKATLGEKLDLEISNNLYSSTLAIILLTKDIESKDGKFYPKQNIIHEIGYFMRHFEGKNKLLILAEEGVELPSNIANITIERFNSNNFDKTYIEILEWFEKIHCFIPSKSIKKAIRLYREKFNNDRGLGYKSYVPPH